MGYRFSPSSLNLLSECPRCFWLQFKLGIKRPAGIFPSLPGGMDSKLKDYFDRYRARAELPPELAKLNGVRLFSDIERLKQWRTNLRGVSWTDTEGNLLRGAVDELLEKDGKLIVLDFKTRGYPLKEDTSSHYQDQLNLYNLLLRKNGFETEDYSYLLFYHPAKVNEDGRVLFHVELKKMRTSAEDALKLFRHALELLNGNMPEPGEGCEYCNYAENISVKVLKV